MQGMGHFPMIENYPEFRPHLLAALDHVAGRLGSQPRTRRPNPATRVSLSRWDIASLEPTYCLGQIGCAMADAGG